MQVESFFFPASCFGFYLLFCIENPLEVVILGHNIFAGSSSVVPILSFFRFCSEHERRTERRLSRVGCWLRHYWPGDIAVLIESLICQQQLRQQRSCSNIRALLSSPPSVACNCIKTDPYLHVIAHKQMRHYVGTRSVIVNAQHKPKSVNQW